jgi:hypothetical protein
MVAKVPPASINEARASDSPRPQSKTKPVEVVESISKTDSGLHKVKSVSAGHQTRGEYGSRTYSPMDSSCSK